MGASFASTLSDTVPPLYTVLSKCPGLAGLLLFSGSWTCLINGAVGIIVAKLLVRNPDLMLQADELRERWILDVDSCGHIFAVGVDAPVVRGNLDRQSSTVRVCGQHFAKSQ